jgi:hypothetical protein
MTTLSCSFCRKSEDQVEKHVAGPSGVTISDACVTAAVRIMDAAGPPTRASLWRRFVLRVRALVAPRGARLLAADA